MRIKITEQGPKAVTAYIAAAPLKVRVMLKQIRAAIKAAAPQAQEKLSYGMPYYSHKGRLAYFAAFRSHVSVFTTAPTRRGDGLGGAVAAWCSRAWGMKRRASRSARRSRGRRSRRGGGAGRIFCE